jgi:hypothetical protein
MVFKIFFNRALMTAGLKSKIFGSISFISDLGTRNPDPGTDYR